MIGQRAQIVEGRMNRRSVMNQLWAKETGVGGRSLIREGKNTRDDLQEVSVVRVMTVMCME